MSFRKHLQPRDVGFQMAPMIDVVFLLLIFFMVASIFAQWETKIGIEVPTAETGDTDTRDPSEIIVNLDAAGDIYINSIEMKPFRVERLLGIISDTYKGHAVIIRADRRTHHEKVMNVLDICRKVDIWNVSFSTLPDEKP